MFRKRAPLGVLLYFSGAIMLGVYFTFAAIQGDYGIFKRAEIIGERHALQEELAKVESDVARMENLTRRLSDTFLDLDLLDEQARDVLGMVRADEVVVQ